MGPWPQPQSGSAPVPLVPPAVASGLEALWPWGPGLLELVSPSRSVPGAQHHPATRGRGVWPTGRGRRQVGEGRWRRR
ncbi:MAG TPA: hypothetical protein VK611_28660, partial [Acidimicrobiales bacterium]|nr:hypothetical protein [Acidimicrobiales bacterium]